MLSRNAVESTSKSKLLLAGILALLISMITMWGCSANEDGAATEESDPVSAEEAAEQDQIQVDVIVKDDTNTTSVDFKDFDDTITILEDANVLGALEETGLKVEQADDGPYGTYVNSIEELQNEGDKEWTFTVNGKSYNDTPANVTITNGDVIEWTYKVVDENTSDTEMDTDDAAADEATQGADRETTEEDGEEVETDINNR